VDDALALLLAGASPELEVLAVSTVGGNVGVARGTENARRILPVAWGSQPPPPIYPGSQSASEDAEQVHGSDGLGGAAEQYPPSAPASTEHAVAAFGRLVRARPGEISLVSLGPLTNVAQLVQQDPQGARLLREVVVMGGAFGVAGNVTPVAEYNIYADVDAAQVVCDSGLSLRWVPVNITQRCLLLEEQLSARLADATAEGLPRLRMAQAISQAYIHHHWLGFGERACILHDPVAVGAVLWPELFHAEPFRVDVETFGRLTRGMTVADFRPGDHRDRSVPNALVCLDVDHEEFVRRFLDRLCAA